MTTDISTLIANAHSVAVVTPNTYIISTPIPINQPYLRIYLMPATKLIVNCISLFAVGQSVQYLLVSGGTIEFTANVSNLVHNTQLSPNLFDVVFNVSNSQKSVLQESMQLDHCYFVQSE